MCIPVAVDARARKMCVCCTKSDEGCVKLAQLCVPSVLSPLLSMPKLAFRSISFWARLTLENITTKGAKRVKRLVFMAHYPTAATNARC